MQEIDESETLDSSTGDGGIDIYASFHAIPILIQCKRLQKEVSVGIFGQSRER